ncbi:hypothetical protein Tco_1451183, partial [Tanacetum coccineum]
GSTKKELCEEFEKLMKDKFQMSSMGDCCHRNLLPPVGVATVAPPSPTKPKKGKAALLLKSDRDEEDEEENGEEGGGLSQSRKELKKL